MKHSVNVALIGAMLLAFVTTARSQTVLPELQATPTPFCLEQDDIMEMARADLAGDKQGSDLWRRKLKLGRCAVLTAEAIYIRTVAHVGTYAITEMRLRLNGWHTVYVMFSDQPARLWQAALPRGSPSE